MAGPDNQSENNYSTRKGTDHGMNIADMLGSVNLESISVGSVAQAPGVVFSRKDKDGILTITIPKNGIPPDKYQSTIAQILGKVRTLGAPTGLKANNPKDMIESSPESLIIKLTTSNPQSLKPLEGVVTKLQEELSKGLG